MEYLLETRVKSFIEGVEALEVQQKADIKSKTQLEQTIEELGKKIQESSQELDLYQHAIPILRDYSDETVKESYDFVTDNINATLERIFEKTTRKISIHEFTRSGQYPQLEILLHVEGGKTRSLKLDSGHGLMQIISLLCIICLIVITHSRRLLAIDEVLSGLSAKARRIIAEILWSFTQIGFQFIISEHGFIPKGAKVYHLQMDGGISHIENEYIEQNGVYLNGVLPQNREYKGDDSESESKPESESKSDEEATVVTMGNIPAEEVQAHADQYIAPETTRGAVEGEMKSANVIQI